MSEYSKIIDSSMTGAIIGAALEVYEVLGHGFSEVVYQHALASEFKARGIPFQREALLKIHYKDSILEPLFKADFVCFDKIIVELKAVSELVDAHKNQVYNYLKASHLQVGLLFNFGKQGGCEWRRVVCTKGAAKSAGEPIPHP